MFSTLRGHLHELLMIAAGVLQHRTVLTRIASLPLIVVLLEAPRPGVADPAAAAVRGVVLDEQTRAAVSGAEVTRQGGDGGRTTATTDAAGRFSMAVSRPGTYTLSAERLSYRSAQERTLTVELGDTVTIGVTMSPTPIHLDSILVAGRRDVRPLGATEQLIHGKLLDDETRAPIPDANVLLFGSDGGRVSATVTDQRGLFRLVSPVPGAYRLRAERIGYRTAEPEMFPLMLGDTVRIDFVLSKPALILEPIVVTGSVRPLADRYPLTGMERFFQRMADWNNIGYFLSRDQLQQYSRWGYTASKVVSEMALSRPRGCTDSIASTLVYLDGGLIGTWELLWEQGLKPDDMFPPGILEAVELYVAPTLPAELVSGQRFPCRVIVFWTIRQPKR